MIPEVRFPIILKCYEVLGSLLWLRDYSFPPLEGQERKVAIFLHSQQPMQASNISDLFKSPSKWHISHSAASCFQKSNKITIDVILLYNITMLYFSFHFLLFSFPSFLSETVWMFQSGSLITAFKNICVQHHNPCEESITTFDDENRKICYIKCVGGCL